MRVISVNLCHTLVEAEHGGERELTGHFKTPVTGRARVTRLGLDGDHIADAKHHGGADMALYAITYDTHWRWARELGRTDLKPSTFGENLTVEGMPDDRVCIGDIFRIRSDDDAVMQGSRGVLVQVSVPRAPCWKLGVAMKDSSFPKVFLESCRVGFYLRVLEEGTVGVGDVIELVQRDAAGLTVEEVTRLMYFDHSKAGAARAAGVAALKESWREKFAQRLA